MLSKDLLNLEAHLDNPGYAPNCLTYIDCEVTAI